MKINKFNNLVTLLIGLFVLIDLLFGDLINHPYDFALWILLALSLLVSFGLDLLKYLNKNKNEKKE